MRPPGIGEIVIILVVITIIFLAIRVLGAPTIRKRAEEDEEDADEKIKRTRSSRIQVLGIVFILAGILILLGSLNLVKWVFWGSIWAFIIVAIGAVTIFLARRSSSR